jgi:hypothetical protein
MRVDQEHGSGCSPVWAPVPKVPLLEQLVPQA